MRTPTCLASSVLPAIAMLLSGLSPALSAADATPAAASPPAAAAAATAWVDVTNDLATPGGAAGGVQVVAVAPGSGELIAGVSGGWLWASTDAGATWSPLGTVPNPKNRPSCVLFDPQNPGAFWVGSSLGSPTLFQSTDNGKTFKSMGNLPPIAAISADLTTSTKRLFIAGLYQQDRALEVSENGGQYFSKNYHLPPDLGFTQYVLVANPTTLLVGSSGADEKVHRPHQGGIFQSTDAGHSWTKISESVPSAPPVLGADGTVYWPVGERESVLVSHDHGATWGSLGDPVKYAPMEMDNGWLAGMGGAGQLEISSDHGTTWDAAGPKLPIDPDAVLWDSPAHCFIAWKASDTAQKQQVLRLDVPDPTALVNPSIIRDVVMWDGDTKAVGGGWTAQGQATLAAENTTARQGQSALQWHVDAKTYFINAGWLWMIYPLTDAQATDATGYSKLVLSLKLAGAAKPVKLTFALDLIANGQSQVGTAVDLIALAPKLADGDWHDVAIPLSALGAEGKKLGGLTMTANNGANLFTYDLYLDNIGLSK